MIPSISKFLTNCIYGIERNEVSFSLRGFHAPSPERQAHLEAVGHAFLDGYHAALVATGPQQLCSSLDETDDHHRGFAYEGAAMALALLDGTLPYRRNRWQRLAEYAENHCYMLYVGYGWALARLPWWRRRPMPQLARLDPLLRWLALDGYGFHEGYFHWQRYRDGTTRPRNLTDEAQRAFDQGLGRSLWFVFGTDAVNISEAISRFPAPRRSDLWSGVGLACGYAGGSGHANVAALSRLGEPYAACLAQGAAFAAKARQRAGNPAEHTAVACDILCGMTANSAARITDQCLANLPFDGAKPAFEIWRQRIQAQMKEGAVAAAQTAAC